jgi:hypothetical protein
MSKYRVTSDRLIWPRGTVIDTAELKHCNIDVLLAGGHLSAHKDSKSVKTKDTETEKD